MTVDENEDTFVDAFIKMEEAKEIHDQEFKDFDELDIDFKLERLQTLVKQSQAFSNIIGETLLESSLAKKKEREQEAAEPPKKKTRRSKSNQPSQPSIQDFYGKGISQEAKDTKSKIEQSQQKVTIKQPSLVTGATMREYQLEGTEWLITLYENGLNGILADEMGLGKTLQTIALLAFLYEQGITGSFLVCCPLSVVSSWVKEFESKAPAVPILKYVGTKTERAGLRSKYFKRGGIQGPAVVITSYETVLTDFPFFNKIDWKFLIVDEGHRLKNINCKLIRELKRLQTQNRLLLTGTPLQNNLNELWSLLNFILPDIFHDLELFQKWFDFSSLTDLSKNAKDDKTKRLIDTKIQENLVSNLHTILKPFLLRRMKKNVIKNLPPKREYIVYGSLTSTQSKLYKDALYNRLKKSVLAFAMNEHIAVHGLKFTSKDVENFVEDLDETEDFHGEDDNETYLRSTQQTERLEKEKRVTKKEKSLRNIWEIVSRWVEAKALRNVMMQLRLICNSPYLFFFPWESEKDVNLAKLLENSGKFQLLDQLVPRLLKDNHKILIFSQFTKQLDLIQDWCDLKKLKVSRLDGTISHDDREEEIANFNKQDVKLFLLSTRAGGLGLNLTQADSVIIFDSDWNPQVDLQAMDRIHRIGQTKPCIIYRLVIANTIEQVILAKADSKRKLERLVIQMGKFESLRKLITSEANLTFDTKKKKEETNLAEELKSLYDTNLLEREGLKVEDSLLKPSELDELVDRSPEAYNRPLDFYDEFPHVQIFETTASMG